MVVDTYDGKKLLQNSDTIVRNLLKLRDQLWNGGMPQDNDKYVLLKINSCLYRNSIDV